MSILVLATKDLQMRDVQLQYQDHKATRLMFYKRRNQGWGSQPPPPSLGLFESKFLREAKGLHRQHHPGVKPFLICSKKCITNS